MFKSTKKILATTSALASLMLVGTSAFAADTIELVDKGGLDIGFGMAVENIGPDGGPSIASEIGFTYGAHEYVNVNFIVAQASGDKLFGGEVGITAEIVSTVLDTDYFDIDVFAGFTVDGLGSGGAGYAVAPGFELNIDFAPDMTLAGIYLVAGIPVTGTIKADAEEASAAPEAIAGFELTYGVYYTIADGHQLLLQHGIAIGDFSDAEVELAPLALGYNVAVADGVELVTEVGVAIPLEEEEDVAAHVGVSVVLSM